MRTILVEGASTAAGWYDMEHGGWANRLKLDALKASRERPHDPTVIINKAIPGRTLPAITRDIGEATQYRHIGPVTMAVSIGLNESKIYDGSSYPVVRLTAFHGMLEMFARKTEAAYITPVYVGIQPLGMSRIESQFGNVIEDDLVEEYDALIQDRAYQDGAPYVPTRQLFLEAGLEHVLDDDGYHPNATGHEILRAAVRQALETIN